jgi:hypothetical protein
MMIGEGYLLDAKNRKQCHDPLWQFKKAKMIWDIN